MNNYKTDDCVSCNSASESDLFSTYTCYSNVNLVRERFSLIDLEDGLIEKDYEYNEQRKCINFSISNDFIEVLFDIIKPLSTEDWVECIREIGTALGTVKDELSNCNFAETKEKVLAITSNQCHPDGVEYLVNCFIFIQSSEFYNSLIKGDSLLDADQEQTCQTRQYTDDLKAFCFLLSLVLLEYADIVQCDRIDAILPLKTYSCSINDTSEYRLTIE